MHMRCADCGERYNSFDGHECKSKKAASQKRRNVTDKEPRAPAPVTVIETPSTLAPGDPRQTKMLSLRIDTELLRRIDEVAGKNRSAWIIAALEGALPK